MTIIFYVSEGAKLPQYQDELKRGLDVFKHHLTDEEVIAGVDCYTSDYVICTYIEYLDYISGPRSEYVFRRFNGKKWYILFESDEQFLQALRDVNPTSPYVWSIYYYTASALEGIKGYEVTSKGDKRFSPFFMYRSNGISIEEYYQLDAKGYRGKLSTSEAKGKPPIDPMKVVGFWYQALGDHIFTNKGLFYELAVIGKDHAFTDMFDHNGGQNKIYSEILNNFYNLNHVK